MDKRIIDSSILIKVIILCYFAYKNVPLQNMYIHYVVWMNVEIRDDVYVTKVLNYYNWIVWKCEAFTVPFKESNVAPCTVAHAQRTNHLPAITICEFALQYYAKKHKCMQWCFLHTSYTVI